MATAAQITANRLNAVHSTGPRTEAGKAASARNATRHNLCGTIFVLLPGEDSAAFDALSSGYRAEFRPATPHEDFLVSQMVQARWRLDRIANLEAEAYDAADDHLDRALDRLHRYRCTAERAYYRAKRELDRARCENKTNPIDRRAQPAARPGEVRNEPKPVGMRWIPDPRKPSFVTPDGLASPTGRIEWSETSRYPLEKLYLQVKKQRIQPR